MKGGERVIFGQQGMHCLGSSVQTKKLQVFKAMYRAKNQDRLANSQSETKRATNLFWLFVCIICSGSLSVRPGARAAKKT